MNDQDQSGTAPTSKSRGKGCLLWLGGKPGFITGSNAGGIHLRTYRKGG